MGVHDPRFHARNPRHQDRQERQVVLVHVHDVIFPVLQHPVQRFHTLQQLLLGRQREYFAAQFLEFAPVDAVRVGIAGHVKMEPLPVHFLIVAVQQCFHTARGQRRNHL